MWYIFKFGVWCSISKNEHSNTHALTFQHIKCPLAPITTTFDYSKRTRSTICRTKTYIYLVVKHSIRNCTHNNNCKWFEMGKKKAKQRRVKEMWGRVDTHTHSHTYEYSLKLNWDRLFEKSTNKDVLYIHIYNIWSWAKRSKV